MATTTINSRVRSALDLKEQEAYFAIGKTSPWDIDSAPPQEESDKGSIEEIIGFKKASVRSLCKRLDGGATNNPTVTYRGETWELIPDKDAYTKGATHVIYEVTINGSDLPLSEYRQVGIYLNLEPQAGVTKDILLPSEVESTGILHCYSNNQPLNRTQDMKIVERFITNISGN